MSKTIVVVGFGPGISTAVAKKFGAEGFSVALVARNEERLAAGVAVLKAKGSPPPHSRQTRAIPPPSARRWERRAPSLAPSTVLHWNAFGGSEAGDLLTADPAAVRGVFDVAVVGLLGAVQEALPDLKSTNEGAILITNGAFAETTPQMDEYAVSLKSMGVALANAAKYKLVGLLAQRLKGDGVYVGEVMIAGTIQGTPGTTAIPSIPHGRG